MCGKNDVTSLNLIFHSSKEHTNLSNRKFHYLRKQCLSNPKSFSESRKKTLKELKNIDSVKISNLVKDTNGKRIGGVEAYIESVVDQKINSFFKVDNSSSKNEIQISEAITLIKYQVDNYMKEKVRDTSVLSISDIITKDAGKASQTVL